MVNNKTKKKMIAYENRRRRRRTNNRKKMRTGNNSKRKSKSKSEQEPKPIVYGHVYSAQCGHCINMQNDWDNLNAAVGKDIILMDISGNDPQGKVDTFNTEFQTDLKFEGYPTIFKLSQNGAPTEYYQGERTTDSMKQWLYH